MRDQSRRNRADTTGMLAVQFGMYVPLFTWLHHLAMTRDGSITLVSVAVTSTVTVVTGFVVSLAALKVLRRLPPAGTEAGPAGSPGPVTKEHAAALAVGFAVLSGTGTLLAAIALDTSRAHATGPAYPYVLGAFACIACAAAAGAVSFRRLRKPPA